ncbi:cation channel sperm-associated auxiliary subunit gamma-like isoform X5 [Paroedura picta]|uniref:cation channel sperm-associated auxiliary subunit gamma-like isoform X5 n=1 Tax=Paroedura picta TaxID=143630 RepID=UPI004057957C
MIWQPLLAILSLVRLGLPLRDCHFKMVVNRFDALGGDRELFFKQESLKNQHEIFKELVDSAIDPNDKNAHYLGFPYYLKVNLSCTHQDSARAVRKAHYSGLIPIVTIAFQEPVHSVRQKPELLEIEMKAAPYKIPGNCDSEDLCEMCWYTPMPIMNGSVVMTATVRSNNLGFHMRGRRVFMNINGYVKEIHSRPEFSIGEQMTNVKSYFTLRDSSRPLWYTYNQAPVLILGEIPNSKAIILSDTAFEDHFIIEVAIDSCWISSQKCPWDKFSSSILDAIATESTLFVRQNQLVYYFTGNYSALYMNTSGSELWTRILGKKCVRKLNPVIFPKNNTEYVIALGGGWQEGEFFLITVSDGIVKHASSSKKSVCTVLGGRCRLIQVVYATEQNRFFMLVQTITDRNVSSYYIMAYPQDTEHYEVLSLVPKFIPESNDQGFVVIIGQEKNTDIPMVPKGISYNPFSQIFYIWGNMILQSNDLKNYLYLSHFPSTSSIKYFVQSYAGHYACVTDDEQVWISNEGNSIIRKLYPSRAWKLHINLQLMSASRQYTRHEAMITLFFDKNSLQEQYYSYVASNRNSSGGVHVNMANYVKVYNQLASNAMPETIYLDKNNVYNFSVFFTIRTKEQSLGESAEENSLSFVWLTIIVSHPEYVNVFLYRTELISRGAVLYKVTVKDTGVFPRQDLSGKKLVKSSMIFSVANAVTRCYDHTPLGPAIKGYRVLPVIIGCPPGRRLAFDITGTLKFSIRKNKRYFDCVNPDPEMPCFFFNDVFYPSFLIQDMVTGDSGPFKGSYIFTIIGGGPYLKENIRYFSPEEIMRYNSNNISELWGHIWLKADTKVNKTNDGFHILSGAESGILWVCQEHSPCYDILPRDMLAPHYFFVIRVTNRGVDQTTYCDYALEFIIHVHGLRISPTRAIFLMKVSMSSVVGLVILYMVIYIVTPKVKAISSRFARRLEEAVVLRTGSSMTFSSSATSSQNFMATSDGSLASGLPGHQSK